MPKEGRPYASPLTPPQRELLQVYRERQPEDLHKVRSLFRASNAYADKTDEIESPSLTPDGDLLARPARDIVLDEGQDPYTRKDAFSKLPSIAQRDLITAEPGLAPWEDAEWDDSRKAKRLRKRRLKLDTSEMGPHQPPELSEADKQAAETDRVLESWKAANTPPAAMGDEILSLARDAGTVGKAAVQAFGYGLLIDAPTNLLEILAVNHTGRLAKAAVMTGGSHSDRVRLLQNRAAFNRDLIRDKWLVPPDEVAGALGLDINPETGQLEGALTNKVAFHTVTMLPALGEDLAIGMAALAVAAAAIPAAPAAAAATGTALMLRPGLARRAVSSLGKVLGSPGSWGPLPTGMYINAALREGGDTRAGGLEKSANMSLALLDTSLIHAGFRGAGWVTNKVVGNLVQRSSTNRLMTRLRSDLAEAEQFTLSTFGTPSEQAARRAFASGMKRTMFVAKTQDQLIMMGGRVLHTSLIASMTTAHAKLQKVPNDEALAAGLSMALIHLAGATYAESIEHRRARYQQTTRETDPVKEADEIVRLAAEAPDARDAARERGRTGGPGFREWAERPALKSLEEQAHEVQERAANQVIRDLEVTARVEESGQPLTASEARRIDDEAGRLTNEELADRVKPVREGLLDPSLAKLRTKRNELGKKFAETGDIEALEEMAAISEELAEKGAPVAEAIGKLREKARDDLEAYLGEHLTGELEDYFPPRMLEALLDMQVSHPRMIKALINNLVQTTESGMVEGIPGAPPADGAIHARDHTFNVLEVVNRGKDPGEEGKHAGVVERVQIGTRTYELAVMPSEVEGLLTFHLADSEGNTLLTMDGQSPSASRLGVVEHIVRKAYEDQGTILLSYNDPAKLGVEPRQATTEDMDLGTGTPEEGAARQARVDLAQQVVDEIGSGWDGQVYRGSRGLPKFLPKKALGPQVKGRTVLSLRKAVGRIKPTGEFANVKAKPGQEEGDTLKANVEWWRTNYGGQETKEFISEDGADPETALAAAKVAGVVPENYTLAQLRGALEEDAASPMTVVAMREAHDEAADYLDEVRQGDVHLLADRAEGLYLKVFDEDTGEWVEGVGRGTEENSFREGEVQLIVATANGEIAVDLEGYGQTWDFAGVKDYLRNGDLGHYKSHRTEPAGQLPSVRQAWQDRLGGTLDEFWAAVEAEGDIRTLNTIRLLFEDESMSVKAVQDWLDALPAMAGTPYITVIQGDGYGVRIAMEGDPRSPAANKLPFTSRTAPVADIDQLRTSIIEHLKDQGVEFEKIGGGNTANLSTALGQLQLFLETKGLPPLASLRDLEDLSPEVMAEWLDYKALDVRPNVRRQIQELFQLTHKAHGKSGNQKSIDSYPVSLGEDAGEAGFGEREYDKTYLVKGEPTGGLLPRSKAPATLTPEQFQDLRTSIAEIYADDPNAMQALDAFLLVTAVLGVRPGTLASGGRKEQPVGLTIQEAVNIEASLESQQEGGGDQITVTTRAKRKKLTQSLPPETAEVIVGILKMRRAALGEEFENSMAASLFGEPTNFGVSASYEVYNNAFKEIFKGAGLEWEGLRSFGRRFFITNAEKYGLSQEEAAEIWEQSGTGMKHYDTGELSELLLAQDVPRSSGQLKMFEAMDRLSSGTPGKGAGESGEQRLILVIPKGVEPAQFVPVALRMLTEIDESHNRGERSVSAVTGPLADINARIETYTDGANLTPLGRGLAAKAATNIEILIAIRAGAPLSPELERKAIELGYSRPGVAIRGSGLGALKRANNLKTLQKMIPRLAHWTVSGEGDHRLTNPEFQDAMLKMVEVYYPTILKSGHTTTNDTIKGRVRSARSFLEWLEAKYPKVTLDEVTTAHVDGFLQDGIETVNGTQVGIAKTRARAARASLRILFGGLAYEGINTNPAAKAKGLFFEGAGRPYQWTIKRVRQVFEGAAELIDGLLPPIGKGEGVTKGPRREYAKKLQARVPKAARDAGQEALWLRAEVLRMSVMAMSLSQAAQRMGSLAIFNTAQWDGATHTLAIGLGKTGQSQLWDMGGKAGPGWNMGQATFLTPSEKALVDAYLRERQVLVDYPSPQTLKILNEYKKALAEAKEPKDFDIEFWRQNNFFGIPSNFMMETTGRPGTSLGAKDLLAFLQAMLGDKHATTNMKHSAILNALKHLDGYNLAKLTGTDLATLISSYSFDPRGSLSNLPGPGTKK